MISHEQYTPGAAAGAEVLKDGDTWTLVLVRDLRHPPAKVWAALTDPNQLREWAPFDSDRNLGTVGAAKLSTFGTPYVAEKYKAVMKQRLQQFSDLTREVTERMGGLHVDLPTHPAGKEPIFASDGLHLNARGHAVVATEVIRKLGEHLAAKRV